MGGTTSTVDMSGREAKFVKTTVETNPVVMFSKSYCPYCRTAKSILSQFGVDTKVLELDRMEDGATLQDILGQMTRARTVPRIFINGQCIGGCSELKSLQDNGKLKQLLQLS